MNTKKHKTEAVLSLCLFTLGYAALATPRSQMIHHFTGTFSNNELITMLFLAVVLRVCLTIKTTQKIPVLLFKTNEKGSLNNSKP